MPAEALIKTLIYSAYKKPGETVSVSVDLKNVGDEAGYLGAKIIDTATEEVVGSLKYDWVEHGEISSRLSWSISPMPKHDWKLRVEAYHYDFDIDEWVGPDDTATFTVYLEVPLAAVTRLEYPVTAGEGDLVRIEIDVKNYGYTSGDIWARIIDLDTLEEIGPLQTIYVMKDYKATIRWEFTMPDRSLSLRLEAGHYVNTDLVVDWDGDFWIYLIVYELSMETDKTVVYVDETLKFSGRLINKTTGEPISAVPITIEMLDEVWEEIVTVKTDAMGYYAYDWTVPKMPPGYRTFRSAWYR